MSLEQALEDNTQAIEMLSALIAPLLVALQTFSAQQATPAEPPKPARRSRERTAAAPTPAPVSEAAAPQAVEAAAPTPAPTTTAAAAPTPSPVAATPARPSGGDLFDQIRAQLATMGTQRDKILAVFASFGIQRASEAPAELWADLLDALKAA